jgi:hypothetical protein
MSPPVSAKMTSAVRRLTPGMVCSSSMIAAYKLVRVRRLISALSRSMVASAASMRGASGQSRAATPKASRAPGRSMWWSMTRALAAPPGRRQFNRFVKDSAAWPAERQARAVPVATTSAAGRVVVELLAQLVQDGRSIAWPLAVVAESSSDGGAVEFRSYYSQWPLTVRHHQRDPILAAGSDHPGDVVAAYQAALAPAMPKRWLPPSSQTGASVSRADRSTAIVVPNELRELLTMFFSAGAASGCSTARSPTTGPGARWSSTACIRAGSTFPRRPALRSTSADLLGDWRLPASAMTSRHPSKITDNARRRCYDPRLVFTSLGLSGWPAIRK